MDLREDPPSLASFVVNRSWVERSYLIPIEELTERNRTQVVVRVRHGDIGQEHLREKRIDLVIVNILKYPHTFLPFIHPNSGCCVSYVCAHLDDVCLRDASVSYVD